MLLGLPSPILTVVPDVLQHLDGAEALTSLCSLLAKCRGSVEDGRRIENISWRLWYKEMISTTSYRPLTPCSPLTEMPNGRFPPFATSSSNTPTGQAIYEILLGSSRTPIHLRIPLKKGQKQVQQPLVQPQKHDAQPQQRTLFTILPTPEAELLSISIIPTPATGNSSPTATPSGHPTGSSGVNTSGYDSPSAAALSPIPIAAPQVVIVNATPGPTPHPTPPATPTPISMSVHVPVAVCLTTTNLDRLKTVPGQVSLPPVHLLQPVQPASSSNSSSTSYLHPLSRSSEPRTSGPPSTSATERSSSNQGTGTSSMTPPFLGQAQAAISPSALSKPPHPKSIITPQLPPTPDPSTSSVSSFIQPTTTNTDIPSLGSPSVAISTSSHDNVSGNSRTAAAGQLTQHHGTTLSHVTNGPYPNGKYLNSGATIPSPSNGSGSYNSESSTGGWSGSVSPTRTGQKARQKPYHTSVHPAGVPGPLPTSSPSNSSSPRVPSASANAASIDKRPHCSSSSSSRSPNLRPFPENAINHSGSGSSQPQKQTTRRQRIQCSGGSESSRSRSRSRNRMLDGLVMTSSATTNAVDGGGTKPRPRRKGSGSTNGKAAGDRGRYARSTNGYTIYQISKQTTSPPTLAPPKLDQLKKNMFSFGTEGDDDNWEDETGSSISCSRSRSDESASPAAQPQVKVKEEQPVPRNQPNSEQPLPSHKQLNAVVNANGRQIVLETDDDDDDYDDEDDEDDWEEDEDEEAEVDVPVKTVNDESHLGKAADKTANGFTNGVEEEDWVSATDDDESAENGAPATTQREAAPKSANGASWQGRGKEKQQSPSSHATKKSQPYPNPPAPQLLQRAQSSRYIGGAGTAQLRQLPQYPPSQKRPQPPSQPPHNQQPHPNPNSDQKPHRSRHRNNPSVDMSQAAFEAQRQLNLFEKKPKRSYSGLTRTGSGLLSQLMNPDPEIFPENHPYRFRYSSGDIGMSKEVTRLGIAPLTSMKPADSGTAGRLAASKPEPPVAPAPTPSSRSSTRPTALRTSKGSVALPVADAVNASSVKDGGIAKAHRPLLTSQPSSSGYRPKGRPEHEEMEDDTDTEGSQVVEISSVARQKLAALAGKRDAATGRTSGSTGGSKPEAASADSIRHMNSVNAAPVLIQRTQSEHVPGATATTTQQLPLGYPYNLPLAAAPSSPRTVRQLMLRKELSESLRYNLLWQRQLNRAENLGPRRQSSSNVAATFEVVEAGDLLRDQRVEQQQSSSQQPPPNPNPIVAPLVQLTMKKNPMGRGKFVKTGGSEADTQQNHGPKRPSNPRRRTTVGLVQQAKSDDESDGQIHVGGGGGNVVTRTKSWAALAGGPTGMTRMI